MPRGGALARIYTLKGRSFELSLPGIWRIPHQNSAPGVLPGGERWACLEFTDTLLLRR